MVTHEEAERLIADIESKVGSDPTEIAAALNKVARAYYGRGDYPSAIAIARDALSRAQVNLTDPPLDNRATRVLMGAGAVLGAALAKSGQFDEALLIARHMLEISDGALGPNHEESIQALTNIAVTLNLAGRYPDRAAVLQEVLNREETVRGELDPSTLTQRTALANALRLSGDIEAARIIDSESLEVATATFGKNDPRTLEARLDLSGDLAFLGMGQECYEMVRDLVHDSEAVLRPEDPLRQRILQAFSLAKLWVTGGETD